MTTRCQPSQARRSRWPGSHNVAGAGTTNGCGGAKVESRLDQESVTFGTLGLARELLGEMLLHSTSQDTSCKPLRLHTGERKTVSRSNGNKKLLPCCVRG